MAVGAHRLPASARLRSPGEIRALLRAGRRRRCGPLQAVWMETGAGRARVGLIVPRHGRTAVARNRLRRRLRELLRTEALPRLRAAEVPIDLLLRAGSDAYGATGSDLQTALDGCLERILR